LPPPLPLGIAQAQIARHGDRSQQPRAVQRGGERTPGRERQRDSVPARHAAPSKSRGRVPGRDSELRVAQLAAPSDERGALGPLGSGGDEPRLHVVNFGSDVLAYLARAN
jgi:hypothetical protein